MSKLTVLALAFALTGLATQPAAADTSSSAQAFESAMEERDAGGILYENFPLSHWSFGFATASSFDATVASRSNLRSFIGKRVRTICLEAGRDADRCYAAERYLNKAWVVEEEAGFIGAYRLATVFIAVDHDNWFSFEAVAARTMDYLSNGRRELRLYKGFNPKGVLVDGGVPLVDLPVVIDREERTITIWTGTLFD